MEPINKKERWPDAKPKNLHPGKSFDRPGKSFDRPGKSFDRQPGKSFDRIGALTSMVSSDEHVDSRLHTLRSMANKENRPPSLEAGGIFRRGSQLSLSQHRPTRTLSQREEQSVRKALAEDWLKPTFSPRPDRAGRKGSLLKGAGNWPIRIESRTSLASISEHQEEDPADPKDDIFDEKTKEDSVETQKCEGKCKASLLQNGNSPRPISTPKNFAVGELKPLSADPPTPGSSAAPPTSLNPRIGDLSLDSRAE